MKSETEAGELLDKMAKEMSEATTIITKADIVIKAFAALNDEDAVELDKLLQEKMSSDISPKYKDPIYIDGMMNGISLVNDILAEGDRDLRVSMLTSVAMATLVKMKDKFVV